MARFDWTQKAKSSKLEGVERGISPVGLAFFFEDSDMNVTWIKPVALMAALFAFTACSEEKVDDKADAAKTDPAAVTQIDPIVITREGLAGRSFVLDQINGASADFGEQVPSLQFAEDLRLTGAMCNRYMGAGVLEGTTLTAQLASTMMFCSDEKLNTLEQSFYKLLEDGAKLSSSNGLLILEGEGTKLTFRPAQTPAP